MEQTRQLLAPMEIADLWGARELLCHELCGGPLAKQQLFWPTTSLAPCLSPRVRHTPSPRSLPQSVAEEMQWKPARPSRRAAARGDSKKPSMAASGGDPAAAIGGGGLASTCIARLQAADHEGDLAAAGAMGAMGGRFVATGA